MNKLKKSLLLPALLFAVTAFGQRRLELDPMVKTGKLSNGFTYFILHNEEPKNRVYLYLVNKVGSILEEQDQMEAILPGECFCRIHRAHLIALDKVSSFDKHHVYLSGRQLPIGETFRSVLEKQVILLDR